jgi:hypothetical protein
MKVEIVTPYRVCHLQRYGVTVRGNVTSVYPPLVCVPELVVKVNVLKWVAGCMDAIIGEQLYSRLCVWMGRQIAGRMCGCAHA